MPAAVQANGPEVGGLVGHMLAHQRSADQMLQGLIVPSTALWRAGAAGFSAAPLRTDALPNDPKLTPELVASEKRIHELAVHAGKAEGSGARCARLVHRP
jgi:hypothetical protein